MKKVILLLSAVFIFNSCSETESNGVIENKNIDASLLLESNSETVGLIKRLIGFTDNPMVDIECISFDFPVNLLVYNQDLLIRDQFSIDSNQSFVSVLNGLSETEKISISYPIFGELEDGTRLEINSNNQLKEAILACAEPEIFEKIIVENFAREQCFTAIPFIPGADNKYAGAIIEVNADKNINFYHQGEVFTGTINTAIFGVETLININFPENARIAADWNFTFDFQFINNEDVIYFTPEGDPNNADIRYTLMKQCAVDKDFRLGDEGPKGGIVVYDKGFYDKGWRYIEVIDSQLENYAWGCSNTVVGLRSSSSIGFGWNNTVQMVNLLKGNPLSENESTINCNEQILPFSALRALDFRNNSTPWDWFIPSKDEINQAFQVLNPQDFTGNIFWTSNESDISNAFAYEVDSASFVTLPKESLNKLLLFRYF